MTTQILTQARLREVLNYDPDTGVFTWRKQLTKSTKIGGLAGGNTSEGYIAFQIDGQKLYAHRAAWCYTHGAWPEEEIDHINRVRNDNRLINLRLSSRLKNSHNTGKHAKNTSGYKGVTWHARNKKWQVQMRVRHKTYYIGQFQILQDAVQARLQAEMTLYAND